jgi:hypothetical protein
MKSLEAINHDVNAEDTPGSGEPFVPCDEVSTDSGLTNSRAPQHRFLRLLPDSARAEVEVTFEEFAPLAADAAELFERVRQEIETRQRVVDPTHDGITLCNMMREYSGLALEYAETLLNGNTKSDHSALSHTTGDAVDEATSATAAPLLHLEDGPTQGRPEEQEQGQGEWPNDLLPQHRTKLISSGISAAAARACKLRSVTKKSQLESLGFSGAQQRVLSDGAAALVIALFNVFGHVAGYQMRADNPRYKDGRASKYEMASGQGNIIYVPPGIGQALRNSRLPLFITEGALKAISAALRHLCCIALCGVYGWRGSNEFNSLTSLPDWEEIAVKGRQVYIVFDSDVMTKKEVYAALVRLKQWLEAKGATVLVIYLPPLPGGTKCGLDDFFFTGGSVQALLDLATEEVRQSPEEPIEDYLPECPYIETPHGLVYNRTTQHGPVSTPLSNFTARIVGDITEDDGVEQHRLFEIEATCNRRTVRFTIGAQSFTSMNWPTEYLGSDAVVLPGLGTRDHVRAAIQLLSTDKANQRIYSHTGWRRLEDGKWVYLHGGGAIGETGEVGQASETKDIQGDSSHDG